VYAPGDDDVATVNAAALETIADVANALGGEALDAGEGTFLGGVARAIAAPVRRRGVFEHRRRHPGLRSRRRVQDGPAIELEQFVVDGKNVWLMLNFGGDCPEGCTELEASRVRVEKGGGSLTVDLLGSFRRARCVPNGSPCWRASASATRRPDPWRDT
jgi:hypothetical protein